MPRILDICKKCDKLLWQFTQNESCYRMDAGEQWEITEGRHNSYNVSGRNVEILFACSESPGIDYGYSSREEYECHGLPEKCRYALEQKVLIQKRQGHTKWLSEHNFDEHNSDEKED